MVDGRGDPQGKPAAGRIRRRLALTTGLVASTLGGCADLAPHDALPQTSLPSLYAPDLQSGGRAHVGEICWRSLLNPTSPATTLVEQAYANNRDLSIAATRIEEASTLLRLRHLDNRPSIDGTIGASINRTTTGATAAGALLEKLYPDLSRDIGLPETATYPLYQAQLSVTDFEIDLWGRLRNLTAAARARFLAADWNRRAVQLSLLREVVSTYIQLAENTDHGLATQQMREIAVARLQILQKREAGGLSDDSPMLAENDRIHEIDAALASMSLQSATLADRLRMLTGQTSKPDATVSLLRPLVQDDNIDAGLPSGLLLNRPDIRMAEYNLIAARADIGAARALLFPSIKLTGLFGAASTELTSLVASNALDWSAGGAIDLPIFDLAKRRANVKLVEVREKEAVGEYRKAVETAFDEVSDALAARRWYKVQADALDQRIIVLQQRIERAETRERAGFDDGLATLDGQSDLLAARVESNALHAQQAEATMAIYVSLGGGRDTCDMTVGPGTG